MHASVRAAIALTLTFLTASTAAAERAKPQRLPTAPPPLINIVRVKLKPRSSPAYAALEAQIVRAYERAKARMYWICLQSTKDAGDIVYLNLAESQAAWDRMVQSYPPLVKRHPELADLQQRLSKLTLSSVSTLMTRRDDIDRVKPNVDFTSMRSLRLTIVDVTPGREGEFLDAIRTAPPNDGSWLVYEATDASKYALITLARGKLSRNDGQPIPRGLRHRKGVVTRVDTRVYTVRPMMSRPAQASH